MIWERNHSRYEMACRPSGLNGALAGFRVHALHYYKHATHFPCKACQRPESRLESVGLVLAFQYKIFQKFYSPKRRLYIVDILLYPYADNLNYNFILSCDRWDEPALRGIWLRQCQLPSIKGNNCNSFLPVITSPDSRNCSLAERLEASLRCLRNNCNIWIQLTERRVLAGKSALAIPRHNSHRSIQSDLRRFRSPVSPYTDLRGFPSCCVDPSPRSGHERARPLLCNRNHLSSWKICSAPERPVRLVSGPLHKPRGHPPARARRDRAHSAPGRIVRYSKSMEHWPPDFIEC